MRAPARSIGVLGYEGVTALDLFGPSEAFACATEGATDQAQPAYEVLLLGLTDKPFASETGFVLVPTQSIARMPKIDTLIVPGGRGLRDPRTNRLVAEWLTVKHVNFRRVASVCTGIYGLAAAGLLDERRVTTHPRFQQDLIANFPRLVMDPDARYVRDGRFYTSSAVTAGIDLALALIEEDLGALAANQVAEELAYDRRCSGELAVGIAKSQAVCSS